MDALIVGIDVSKNRLDVAFYPTGEFVSVARNAEGIDALIEQLRPLQPARIGIEATGGFETVVAASLHAAGLPVVIVNPAQVRAFAGALGQRAKTDPIDAAVIARFVDATKPDLRPLPDAETQCLSDLVTRRRQIVSMITAEHQRLTRASVPRLRKSIERLIVALQKELSAVETEIDDTIRGSDEWREKEELITSVPGIGKGIARTLLADMPELGTLDRRKIAALAGLAPWTRQSGLWRGRSMIGGGRASCRSALFMGAQSAARFNPVMKAFRDQLVERGKPKMVAITAVARRLLTILNAIVRDKKPWQYA